MSSARAPRLRHRRQAPPKDGAPFRVGLSLGAAREVGPTCGPVSAPAAGRRIGADRRMATRHVGSRRLAVAVGLVATVIATHVSGATAGDSTFVEGFESGYHSWTRVTLGGGSAYTSGAAAYLGTYGLRLAERGSGGSVAYLRRRLVNATPQLIASGWFRVRGEGRSGQVVPLIRLFTASGERVLSVFRMNGSGRLYVSYKRTAHVSSVSLPLGRWASIAVRVRVDGPNGMVLLSVGGRTVFMDRAADLGTRPIDAVQLGNEIPGQAFALDTDAVAVKTNALASPSAPLPTPTAPPVLPSTACGPLQDRVDGTATGGNLDLTGCSYSVSSPIVIDRPMTITGGSIDASTTALIVSASNVTVSGMTILGRGGSANSGDSGIEVRGSSATSYLSGVVLSRNRISGWDGDGIAADFVDGFTFADNDIGHVYYSAIMAGSVKNGRISGNHVHDIPGNYGIAVTRGYGGGLSGNPRSSDIIVSANVFEDLPRAEAVITHGGQRLLIEKNVFRRCGGIAITSDAAREYAGGPELIAPLDVTILDNTIDSGLTDGSAGPAIFFAGASDYVMGRSTELATGIIAGNSISGYGNQSNPDSAAIRARDTSGLRVSHNRIDEASPAAVDMAFNNYDFAISDNTISAPWSETGPRAVGVYVAGDFNTGTIVGNTFDRGSKTAGYVLTDTILVSDNPHNVVAMR